mmetsp:Transcript_68552/g.178534  ORF Transcript_68552/g.178534 Transcript_68552/m.178534 type:complete len:215 (+) Transcript_68552:511-1155(+)
MPIRSGSALVASVLKPCSNRYRSTRKLNRAQSSKPNSENKGFPPPTSVMFSTANTSTISFGSSLVASSSCFLASSSLASPSFASLSFASLSASLASPSLESPSLASPPFALSSPPPSAPSGFSAAAASPSAFFASSAAFSSSLRFFASASACLAGSPAFHSFTFACQPCSAVCHSSSLALNFSPGWMSSMRHISFCLRTQAPKASALSFSPCQS